MLQYTALPNLALHRYTPRASYQLCEAPADQRGPSSGLWRRRGGGFSPPARTSSRTPGGQPRSPTSTCSAARPRRHARAVPTHSATLSSPRSAKPSHWTLTMIVKYSDAGKSCCIAALRTQVRAAWADGGKQARCRHVEDDAEVLLYYKGVPKCGKPYCSHMLH